MEHLTKLLAFEESQLAWVLRLGLHGLRSQLQQALQTTNSDLGSDACQALVEELNVVLQSNEEILKSEDVFETNINELKLQYIADKLLADRELSQYIGEYEFCSTNDGDLWNEIQRLLLRVPEKLADNWRQLSFRLAEEVGAVLDHRVYRQLPFNRCEIMYPGLTGSVKSTGLCLSDRAPISQQLVQEDTSEELIFLAGVVSTCIKFINIDASLNHALKSVDRFGVRSLSSDSERSKYVTVLIERFRRVQSTADNPDPIVILRARLDLDEAIHSLVYLPPCDRYSWWGKLQQETRRQIDSVVERARNAGHQVQVRPLWGTYADVYTWSKDDLQLDIGGVPGEVSACLRVYAKINDEVLPGRVLFRPF
ncbi:hypothetical protein NIES4071_32630 [Calothrix sp. NIES-4071]|nr:hypothetical protein NIES4071_32630 [Calothrix sp. NIES-4071]BAZ57583.1 hypothetical protein NIES4105_32570 [Calothrix sp. NIES-4105]